MTRRAPAVLLACLLLTAAGCDQAVTRNPVPVTRLGLNIDSPTGAVMVRRGDTVSSVSRRYRLNMRDVIEYNDLSPPYHLRENQRLLLPQPPEHVVGRNDTLPRLSKMYGVSISDLVSSNNLASPYTLKEGQRLRLPSRLPAAAAGEGDIAALVQKSKEPDPLPVAAASQPTKTAEKQPPKNLAQRIKTLSLKPLNGQRGDFGWPVQGKVISSYGPKTGGLYNDGINISAATGAPVAAAADGTVVYVGNDLHSYGHMVLVRHAGGFVTAYAHMRETAVARGAQVRRGQKIGAVGNSGTVSQPQLHFEIRKGGQTYDPVRFLGG